jgi:hypothetical protein
MVLTKLIPTVLPKSPLLANPHHKKYRILLNFSSEQRRIQSMRQSQNPTPLASSFVQKKFSNKTSFLFFDDILDYTIKDSGNSSAFTVDYGDIPFQAPCYP